MARKDGMLEFKRGDSFAAVVTETVDGFARDLTGYAFRSQVRDALTGDLIAELSISPVDLAAGAYRLVYPGATAGWPVGRAALDVERVAPDGAVTSTPTLFFAVVRDVTQPLGG